MIFNNLEVVNNLARDYKQVKRNLRVFNDESDYLEQINLSFYRDGGVYFKDKYFLEVVKVLAKNYLEKRMQNIANQLKELGVEVDETDI